MKAVQFWHIGFSDSAVFTEEGRKYYFSLPFEMHNAGGRVKGGESGAKLELVNKLGSKWRKHFHGEKWRAACSSCTTAFSEDSTSHCWLFPILKEITKNSIGKATLGLFGIGVLKSSLHQRRQWRRNLEERKGKKNWARNTAITSNSPKEAAGTRWKTI